MNQPIQKFDWKSSTYERPNEVWVCGRTCDGETCRLGPSAAGDCQIASQCSPEKNGEQFVCSRTPLNGGKCKDGPDEQGNCCQPDASCRPLRSRLYQRRLFTFAAAGAAGLMGFIITVAWPDRGMMSPGAVAAAHAGFENNCAACHAAADGRAVAASHPKLASHLHDSSKCLECHTDLGPSPFDAHSHDSSVLAALTKAALEETGATPASIRFAAMVRNQSDQLACLSCHREHHGRDFDMKVMADQKCQVCHKAQFTDFSHGHPELEDFPFGDRSQIYFDHSRHVEVYFEQREFRRLMPDGISPGVGVNSCKTCHYTDSKGGTMLTRGFEDSCSHCHEQNIIDNGFPGIPMLAFTSLGESEEAKSVTWPSTGDQLSTMPPFMLMLLEPGASLMTASKQAEAVETLFDRLSNDPEQFLTDRLGKSHPAAIRSLAGIAPSAAQAADDWLAESRRLAKAASRAVERENRRAGAREVADGKPQPILEGPAANVTGPVTINQDPRVRDYRGWYGLNSDLTVRYRPAAHQDPVLKDLIDYLVAQGGDQSDDANVVQMFQLLAHPSGSETFGTRGPFSTGRCLSCHTVVESGGERFVNWTAKRRRPHSLTHFRHSPHMNRTADNCQSCHELSKSLDDVVTGLLDIGQVAKLREDKTGPGLVAYLKSEAGRSDLGISSKQLAAIEAAVESADTERDFFRSEFFTRDSEYRWRPTWDPNCPVSSGLEPLTRANCARCHNPTGVSQSCLECHNYHIHSKR